MGALIYEKMFAKVEEMMALEINISPLVRAHHVRSRRYIIFVQSNFLQVKTCLFPMIITAINNLVPYLA